MGLRGDVGDGTNLEARRLQGTDGGFTTGTRALTNTSTFLTPCSIALRAADSAAIPAAYGVDLREPLKPTSPPDAQDTTAPDGSVIEMIVLLKVDLM